MENNRKTIDMLSPNIPDKRERERERERELIFFPTMYNTQFNIQFKLFIVHSMLQKKCNQLLHELDMFEKARNNIKLDSIPYFYL